MKIINNLTQPPLTQPSVVTIGNFDGVHLGHQKLIRSTVLAAHANGYHSVLVTFFPHPDTVLGLAEKLYLSTKELKLEEFERLGIDLAVVIPFSKALAQMEAEAFVDLLIEKFQMRELWIGHDFALGRKRKGDATFLKALGKKRAFEFHAIEPVMLNQMPISSSRIRQAIRAGELDTATACLGRPFQIQGRVQMGAQRGRTLGFPTANLAYEANHALPATGVYACRVRVDNATYLAVTNVGKRPTFDNGAHSIEAHLLDFAGDLYGKVIRLDFIKHLRPERKFESVEMLIAQINTDVDRTRHVLLGVPGMVLA